MAEITARIVDSLGNVTSQTKILPTEQTMAKLVVRGSDGYTPGTIALQQHILNENPTAFVHTGDLDFSDAGAGACTNFPGLFWYCNGTTLLYTRDQMRANYLQSQQSVLNHPAKKYVAWGNHEASGTIPKGGIQTYFRQTYGQDFGGTLYYRIDVATGLGLARCLFINTNPNPKAGTIPYQWLESELIAAQDRPWLFVFGHQQPYTRFKPFPSDFPVALLNKYNVDLYVGGHPLAYERTHQVTHNPASPSSPTVVDTGNSLLRGRGIVYLTVGGSGMHPYGTMHGPGAIQTPLWYHSLIGGWTYVVLEWSADGQRLTISVRGLPGVSTSQEPTSTTLQTLETFTIQH